MSKSNSETEGYVLKLINKSTGISSDPQSNENISFYDEELDARLVNTRQTHQLLGKILLQYGIIDEKVLNKVLENQHNDNLRLGEILLKNKLVSEKNIKDAICKQLDIPFLDLKNADLDQELTRIINHKYALRHYIIPVRCENKTLTLVMNDPTNSQLVEELEVFTKLKIKVATALSSDLQGAFERLYGNGDDNDLLIACDRQINDDKIIHINSPEDKDPVLGKKEIDEEMLKRIDRVVQKVIAIGLQKKSSDIHFEASNNHMTVRLRIDGVLRPLELGEMQKIIDRNSREIVSRIKILGSLDIAEKRVPQDGSFRILVKRGDFNSEIDFRISIVPSYYGESIVLRILDKLKLPKNISELNLSPALLKNYDSVLRNNSGIILVTGPTGSGKSTTLYSSLMSVYEPGKKIVTVEDPVEYVFDEFIQCQVNEKIGLNFAKYIRSFLRHDPEIILVGEIRDKETAEMAIRASQTGHLVLSSLHTNDAIGSVNRLRSLGISSDMIASTLLGVLSQRLVRKICPKCCEEYKPKGFENIMACLPSVTKYYHGTGCPGCDYSGYRGRIPLAELWTPSREDMLLIMDDVRQEHLEKSAVNSTLSMYEEAVNKLSEGLTTIDEIVRVVPHSIFIKNKKVVACSSQLSLVK